jgi:ubiquinone/menaquinone biosynthesis C-methylase UbiE
VSAQAIILPDAYFADAELAAFYDLFCADRADFDFYLPYVMDAPAVLDVGCGTGALLHMARARGHAGRLCGLDPAAGMLAQARIRDDIEWVQGTLSSVRGSGEFDLVLMTGHAFQVLLSDDEILRALAAVHAVLGAGGRFAFETRNPAIRGWEHWNGAYRGTVEGPDGAVTMRTQLDAPMREECVTFTHIFECPAWGAARTSTSTLRFIDAEVLARMLEKSGFVIEEQFGDWHRQPFQAASPEIITIARRSQP